MLNSTKIDWGNDAEEVTIEDGINTYGNDEFLTVDISGDGITDILAFNKEFDDELEYDVFERFYIYYRNKNGVFYSSNNDLIRDNYYDSFSGDFDGDGDGDIALVRMEEDGYVYLDICKIEGNNLVKFAGSYFFPFTGERDGVKFNVADFNGNGKQDIMALSLNSEGGIGNMKILEINDNSGNLLIIAHKTLTYMPEMFTHNVIPGDFNGDGKTDIMCLYQSFDIYNGTSENGSEIFELDKVGNDYELSMYYTGVFPTHLHTVLPGDFNGDGKTDLLTWNPDTYWHINLSKGTSFSENISSPNMFTEEPNIAGGNSYNYVVADFNGDGKSDISEQYLKPIGLGVNGDIYFVTVFYIHYSVFYSEEEILANTEL